MRVAIEKATLKRHRACRAAYTSPEWDVASETLVYSDWEQSVQRLLSGGDEGKRQLEWLVNHELVPMTKDEFVAARSAYDSAHGGDNV